MNGGDLIEAVWTGRAFEPRGNWNMARCCDALGEGQVVYLDVDPARTRKTHNHQFGFVQRAFDNMPEYLADMPYAKTPDTLRKHALIACGYCDTSMLPVGSARRAERVAALVNRLAVDAHGYAITDVEGSVIYCHTPHSQKERAMGKAAFQESKQAIGEWLADLIGVPAESLMRAVAA